jgi:signal transduction histidine kinase
MDLLLISPWPYLATAALAALTGIYVWTRPHRPGTHYFGWLAVLWLVWSLAAALQVIVRYDPLLLGLFILMSCISMVESVLHLMIALEYTGNEKWLARREMNILFLPAVLVALMYILWPDWVGIMDVHAGVQVITGNASVKWIFASYPLLISLLTLGVLLNCMLRAPAFWAPLLLLGLGRIFPTVGYLAVEPRNIPVAPVQATVLFTSFTILLYLVALYSFRVLQVIPVARDAVIAHMPYSLIVLDAENRLVDFNAAAQSLPGLPGKLNHQQPAPRALGGWWDRLSPLIGPERTAGDVPITTGADKRIYHITSLPLAQTTGRRIGQALMVEDITEEIKAEEQIRSQQQALAMLGERERLARELHDSLGQVLSSAGFQLEAVQGRIQDGREIIAGSGLAEASADLAEASSQLARLSSIVEEAHADIREHILNLRLAPSEERPFFATLQQYLDGFSQNYGIPAALSVGPEISEGLFDPGAQMQLYRIIQEALSNARKHAGASRLQVAFAARNGQVRVTIQDNGRGFDPALVVPDGQDGSGHFGEGHFGLRFMRERAEALGGCLSVISQPGQGTQVVMELPAKGGS